ncbi:MAG: farnesyl diphosphate synthase [Gammaproteobacteria bacterium]
MNLSTHIESCRRRLDALLDRWLPSEDTEPTKLHRAMRYASLNAGKRLRPLIVYLVGDALGADKTDLDASALAVECIHVYSLIHDDLPAMDDDDLRRGKATTHIAFDEATAILAGDALQTIGFNILCHHPLSPDVESERIRLLTILTDASGSVGMGGGQMIDLIATDSKLSIEQLEAMHRMKTGALISACVKMAVATSQINEAEIIAAFDRFADRIGLAFQVKDDILDIEGETEVIGKPSGSDEELNKSTFPALMGLDAAKEYAQQLIDEALLSLEHIPYNTEALEALAKYMIERQY